MRFRDKYLDHENKVHINVWVKQSSINYNFFIRLK